MIKNLKHFETSPLTHQFDTVIVFWCWMINKRPSKVWFKWLFAALAVAGSSGTRTFDVKICALNYIQLCSAITKGLLNFLSGKHCLKFLIIYFRKLYRGSSLEIQIFFHTYPYPDLEMTQEPCIMESFSVIFVWLPLHRFNLIGKHHISTGLEAVTWHWTKSWVILLCCSRW